MNDKTLDILLNREVIAVQQDPLAKQGERIIADSVWNVFLKPLQNGDYCLAILNRSEHPERLVFDFDQWGLPGKYLIRDLWLHRTTGSGKNWTGDVMPHETRLLRLTQDR